jgi:CBS domain containing-hemolysin-like protein
VPEEERGRYHTLSGMIMLLTGSLPKVADVVEWENWHFEIADMDGRTIDKVLATLQIRSIVSAENHVNDESEKDKTANRQT